MIKQNVEHEVENSSETSVLYNIGQLWKQISVKTLAVLRQQWKMCLANSNVDEALTE